MASMWRRAMLYLGLGPDEEYDDHEAEVEPATVASRHAPAEPEATGTVRTIGPTREPARDIPPPPTHRTSVVRPITQRPNPQVHITGPSTFDDAQEVADNFMGGQPVIMNLQGADRDLARRLIDFASGLCYGLSGEMKRVANQVYLLTPSDVEVSAEEKRRLQERGLFKA